MSSRRVQPPRAASKPDRRRRRQETMVQNLVEPFAVNKNHMRASCSADGIKSSTIELSSPTFAIDCMSGLYELYQQSICCDVILSAGDFQTSAHKVVLMALSEYFKSLFLASMSRVELVVVPPGVSGECLHSLIRFMYVGNLYLNSDNIQRMHRAATELMVKPAINLCERFLSENENLFAVVATSSPAAAKLENNFDQIAEVQIKKEISYLDDIPNVDFSLPESKVESIKSSSAIDISQIRIRLNQNYLPVVTSSPRNNRKQGEKKKQRPSTLLKSQDRKTDSRLVKKGVRSRKSLPRHSKRSPSGTVWHQLQQCHICGSGFVKHSELLSHRKLYHNISSKSPESRFARNLFYRSVRAKLKSSSFDGESAGSSFSEVMKWSCPFCHSQFSRRSQFRAHILKRHPPKFKQLSLKRTRSYPRCSRPSERVLSVGVFKCPLCSQPFLHQSTLIKHCAAKHQRIKALDCSKRKYRKSEWRCQQNDCNAICRSAEQVKRHMAAEHPSVLFSCPDCKFMSQVERVFLRHRAERHGKAMMCHMCGKGCYKLYQLRQHMYVHHKIRDPKLKLFQCSFEGCMYECSSKKRLEDHLTRHTLTKSITCDVCGKGFKHNIGLERHKSAIHQGIRPYICDQCGIGFGLIHELKNHIARHSNNKPHACDQCPYRTYDKINLQCHLFSQHNIQTNRKLVIFKCEQCAFTSNRRGRFDDHMKKHKNIKDIPCPECGKLFHSKRNLYGHTVKVHRPKSLRCSLCNFSTAIRSKFKEHMQKKHIRSPMLAAPKQSNEVVGSD